MFASKKSLQALKAEAPSKWQRAHVGQWKRKLSPWPWAGEVVVLSGLWSGWGVLTLNESGVFIRCKHSQRPKKPKLLVKGAWWWVAYLEYFCKKCVAVMRHSSKNRFLEQWMTFWILSSFSIRLSASSSFTSSISSFIGHSSTLFPVTSVFLPLRFWCFLLTSFLIYLYRKAWIILMGFAFLLLTLDFQTGSPDLLPFHICLNILSHYPPLYYFCMTDTYLSARTNGTLRLTVYASPLMNAWIKVLVAGSLQS